jgi:ApaG protein
MNLSEAIKITVDTCYLPQQSTPEADRYAFAYTIAITNEGKEAVQLLNRQWHITDDRNQVEEVVGEGVVGQQPVIEPGQSFQYTSGAIIKTEMGSMCGSYGMKTAGGETFRTNIPPFLLGLPYTVH